VVNGNGGVTLGSDIRKLASLSTPAMRQAERGRLKDAAEVIAAQARANAAWSKRIPAATRVGGGLTAGGVYVRTPGKYARNAAPFEFGKRHPLFARVGSKRYSGEWYPTPHRPYMEDAAEQALDRAAEKYAEIVDDWAHQLGFK
jgi:hypothetical protein